MHFNNEELLQKLEECKKGNHPLRDIYMDINEYGECDVVRWCPICGAIVVDVDYDNRTNPGEIMKMKDPLITKFVRGQI